MSQSTTSAAPPIIPPEAADPALPSGMPELDRMIEGGLRHRTLVAAANRTLRTELLLSLAARAVSSGAGVGAIIVGGRTAELANHIGRWTAPDPASPNTAEFCNRVRFVQLLDPPLDSTYWCRGGQVDRSSVAAAVENLRATGVRSLLLVVEDLESVGAFLRSPPATGQTQNAGPGPADYELDLQRLQTVGDLRATTRSPEQPAGAPVLVGVGLLKSRWHRPDLSSIRGHARVTEEAHWAFFLEGSRNTRSRGRTAPYSLSVFHRRGSCVGSIGLWHDGDLGRFSDLPEAHPTDGDDAVDPGRRPNRRE